MENKPKAIYIDHLSIIVRDIKKTADFYGNFLGEPIQYNEEKVVYKIGGTTIYFRLPFIEWESGDKDKSGLNHLAFGVANIRELESFGKLLNDAGIKNNGIKTSKMGRQYIWFDDPDGYRLEFYLNPEYSK